MNKMNLQLFGEAEDAAVDILQELDEDYESMSEATQIEVAKLAQLKRIADVLEDINGQLISMSIPLEDMARCVSYAPPRYRGGQGYHFLTIAGSVDTE